MLAVAAKKTQQNQLLLSAGEKKKTKTQRDSS